MGTTTERIQVIIEAVNKSFSRTMNSVRQNMRAFNGVTGATNKSFQHMTTESGRLNRRLAVMDMAGGRAAARFRLFTRGMKGFKMEMLGVMFFGMAMANMFKNLLSPVSKVFNIFELWSTTLTVLFLPIMELLFPLFLKFSEAIMNSSEGFKIFMGILTLLGVILGTVLFIVGTLVLGLGALGVAAGTAFAAIAIGILVVIAISAVITALILVIKNWGKISDWLSAKWKNGTNAISDFFKNMVNNVSGFLEDMVNKAIDGINFLIEKINKIPGVDIETIGEASFATDLLTSDQPSGVQSGLGNIAAKTGIVINNTYNGFTSDDLNVKIEESNAKMVDDITNRVGPYIT